MRFSVALALVAFPTVALAGPTQAPVIGGAVGGGGQVARCGRSSVERPAGMHRHADRAERRDHRRSLRHRRRAERRARSARARSSRPSEGETIPRHEVVSSIRARRPRSMSASWCSRSASKFAPRPIATRLGALRHQERRRGRVRRLRHDRQERQHRDRQPEGSAVDDHRLQLHDELGLQHRGASRRRARRRRHGHRHVPRRFGRPDVPARPTTARSSPASRRAATTTRASTCSEGGIYGRPDKIVDWIEQQTGAKLLGGPTPEARPHRDARHPGETRITHNDPKSDRTHVRRDDPAPIWQAAVSESGVLRVCPNKDVVGTDSVTVTVTDKNDHDALGRADRPGQRRRR